MTTSKPRIFVFVNSGWGTDWQVGIALADDGTLLAQHISSSREFFRQDLGLASERKHDAYSGHYPLGYELVEVPDDEVLTHPELREAYTRNQELAAVAKDRP